MPENFAWPQPPSPSSSSSYVAAAATQRFLASAGVTGTNSSSLEDMVAELQQSAALIWALVCGFLAVSMQLGFAMLEVGSVREAHRMTVLVKNVMDSTVSCICFWMFLQMDNSLLQDKHGTHRPYLLLGQWAFCASCVTICSGAMAERTHVLSYLCFAALMSGIIYPVVATSIWTHTGLFHEEFHTRFHSDHSHHDFAGGGAVHLTGGCAALMGCIILGRRIFRPSVLTYMPKRLPSNSNNGDSSIGLASTFNDIDELDEHNASLARPSEGWQRRFDKVEDDAREFRTCSYLQVMGMFTLWVGWYGFNSGSTHGCMDRACGLAASTVAWNTTLAACGGGIGAYLFQLLVHRHLCPGFLCNGVLSGLVAITAGCDIAQDVGSLLVGLIAGLVVFPMGRIILRACLVDDPVDAIPVHLFSGFFGVLAVAFLHPNCEALAAAGGGMKDQDLFCSDGHSLGKQLLAQAWGAGVELLWTSSIAGGLWMTFAICEVARSLEREIFDTADSLVDKMVSETPSPEAQAEIAKEWKEVALASPHARRILKGHGWNGEGFDEHCAPHDIYCLRMELKQARGEKIETALELGNYCLVRSCARLLHACAFVRESLILRMRIAPVSEISGLGAADLDGGQLSTLLYKALSQISEVQRESSPLKSQVRELALAVHSQESVLNALVHKGGRRVSPRSVRFWKRGVMQNRVPPVPEQDVEGDVECPRTNACAQPPALLGAASHSLEGSLSPSSPSWSFEKHQQRGSSSSSGNNNTAANNTTATNTANNNNTTNSRNFGSNNSNGGARGSGHTNRTGPSSPTTTSSGVEVPPLVPGLGLLIPQSVSGSISTDRTVSDRSAGILSPRSAGDSTPPPSQFGGRVPPTGFQAGVNDANVTDVASQLMNMLSAQQALLYNLQGVLATPNQQQQQHQSLPQSGRTMPANPTGLADHQAITSALQQMMRRRDPYRYTSGISTSSSNTASTR